MAWARIWFGTGAHLDAGFIAPEDEADFEKGWREVYCRVEWLASPKGRLDRALPQTLPHMVHNLNVRSWVRARKGRNRTR